MIIIIWHVLSGIDLPSSSYPHNRRAFEKIKCWYLLAHKSEQFRTSMVRFRTIKLKRYAPYVIFFECHENLSEFF